jgi:hypothetical protein
VPASAPGQSRCRSGNLGRITNCMTRKECYNPHRALALFRKDPAWSRKYEGGWKGRRKAAFFIVATDDAAARQRFVWTDFARWEPCSATANEDFARIADAQASESVEHYVRPQGSPPRRDLMFFRSLGQCAAASDGGFQAESCARQREVAALFNASASAIEFIVDPATSSTSSSVVSPLKNVLL